jgi:BlaI family transcriptional regulator, penicillinase repressor
MAPRSNPNRPTEAELEILQVLWQRGPSTARQVMEALSAQRETGYTTALKLLQIMLEKGLVTRDESERTHTYAASAPRAELQSRLVEDFVERVFGGSAEQLMMSALGTGKAKPAELERIRALLDEAAKKRRK